MTIDEKIDQIEQPGRRAFIKGMAGLFGAAALLGPKALFSQEKVFDQSWGSFYSLEKAIDRYSDVREAFSQAIEARPATMNLHIYKVSDQKGTRYRILTLSDQTRDEAVKAGHLRFKQFRQHLLTKKLSQEEMNSRLGEISILPHERYGPSQEMTPEPKKAAEIKVESPIVSNYYIQLTAQTDVQKADYAKLLATRVLGIQNVHIMEEKISGTTYFKTVIGPYTSGNKKKAVKFCNKIFESDELSDLIAKHELYVLKIVKKGAQYTTDWSDFELVRKVKKASKEKTREYGNKIVSTEIGTMSINQLVEKVVLDHIMNNKDTRIHRALVYAVIWSESKYDPESRGYKVQPKKGGGFERVKDKNGEDILTAYGLMQVTRNAANDLGINFNKIVTDPYWNIKAGVTYLDKMIKLFNGDLTTAIAAYNCGPTRLLENKKAWKRFKETTGYVDNVTTRRLEYQRSLLQ